MELSELLRSTATEETPKFVQVMTACSIWLKNQIFRAKCGKFLTLSAMHDGYDFDWEREWRVLGSVEFELDDSEFVLLPEGTEIGLRLKLQKQGLMVVCPTWGWEKMIERQAEQIRRMRNRLLKHWPKLL